jgi:hypothetical protein
LGGIIAALTPPPPHPWTSRPVTTIYDLETSNFKLKLFLHVNLTYSNFIKIRRRFPPTASYGFKNKKITAV